VNAEENLIGSLNFHRGGKKERETGDRHGNVYGDKSHRYTDIQRKIFRVE
jgi:hypothetical protein